MKEQKEQKQEKKKDKLDEFADKLGKVGENLTVVITIPAVLFIIGLFIMPWGLILWAIGAYVLVEGLKKGKTK